MGGDAPALVLDLRFAEGVDWGSAAGRAGRFVGAPPEIAPCMRRIVYRSLLRPPSQGGEHAVQDSHPNTRGHLYHKKLTAPAASRLSHAQVRFLLPVLPLFNVSAAAAVWRVWNNRGKSCIWQAGCCCAVALLAASLAATVLMAAVSRHNYPGGHALAKLHRLEVAEAETAQIAGVTDPMPTPVPTPSVVPRQTVANRALDPQC